MKTLQYITFCALFLLFAIGSGSEVIKSETQKDFLSLIAETEIQNVIRAEIKNAIRAGAKDAGSAAKNSAKNIEASVLLKTGLNSLTGVQKSALRIEVAKIAFEEFEAAAKLTSVEDISPAL